jgi:Na+-transporting NADH:ubiquinone oxidoreductase subunit NqrF
MEFFSACSGECEDCFIHYAGGCLAGHGDDHFHQITKEEAIRLIKQKKVKGSLKISLKKKFKL